ncbi:hypothetical protein LZG04_17685 [Saccharothrix sp. S26]|uniref:hypothetical protein n=1 Tax=Saccharothrix sp. S26 TaxID=2907215 RepID=UPI001F42D1AA|nr:hypothetical protein [Saccharothrix sp. S26]MCE6996620.1 hypothetical protein [Saccharothrix sp. S26]
MRKLDRGTVIGAVAVALLSVLTAPAGAADQVEVGQFYNFGRSKCATPEKAAAGNYTPDMKTCLTGSAAAPQVHDVFRPENKYYLIKSRAYDVCIGAKNFHDNLYTIIYIECTDRNARFTRIPALGGWRYALADGGAKGEYLYGTDYAVHSDKTSEGNDRVWRVRPLG